MSCQDYELDLGDLVDGALAPERRGEVERHLDRCAACRALVADFQAIVAAARTLEAPVVAPHVWHRIADAIEQAPASMPWWRLPGGGFAWRPVAAAAVMVLAMGGGSFVAWRDASRTTTSGPVAMAQPETTGAANPVQFAEQQYATAIADLEQITRTETAALGEETAQVVQANLAVLDTAIGQSRAALESEPSSAVAQESLFDALRSKVQLLQDTVALINEMRKGNPEGAARIMSGMNP